MVKRFVTKKGGEITPFKIILDEQSVAWNEARNRERGDRPRTLYASDYGACMKKIWCQFFPKKFPTEPFPPRLLRIFHNGESVHERLAQYLHNSELTFLEEVDIPRDDLDVHGRADGLAMQSGRFHVLEFKSMNVRSVYVVKEEHEGQCMWYMHMWENLRLDLRDEFGFKDPDVAYEEDEIKTFNSDLGRKYDELTIVEKMLLLSNGPVKGEVIVESKQTQEIFAFPIELDQGKIAKVRKWFEQLAWFVEMEKMPTVRYDKKRFPCSGSWGKCSYYDVCYGKE
ncbi:hypothetical protein GOV11_03485 [Candidatus Woesearchaeota archaeon]|nr:hypothetical protein [Candidatus Woesearchaeota archaeon]